MLVNSLVRCRSMTTYDCDAVAPAGRVIDLSAARDSRDRNIQAALIAVTDLCNEPTAATSEYIADELILLGERAGSLAARIRELRGRSTR